MWRWGIGSLGIAVLLAAGPTIADDNFGLGHPAGQPIPIRAARLQLTQATSALPQPTLDEGEVNTASQRAALIEEDAAHPDGDRVGGSVVWRTEPVEIDGKPEIALRADVEIPARRMKMTMILRRNTDQALPASYTMDVRFTLPSDFAGGGIDTLPGIMVKPSEDARGAPIAAVSVKVSDGIFLLGFSSLDSDKARNLQLLRERAWFDIPIVYKTKRRAILAIEQASPQHKPFETAFGFWERTSHAGAK
jgi:hypothetical protein